MNIEVITLRDSKIQQIKEYINNDENKNLSQQGSLEWLEMRKTIIGGSELASLINLDPWKKECDIVRDKCFYSSYKDRIETKWGNIFEEVSKIIIHLLFINDIKNIDECIFESGSIKGAINYHRYSPDGLTVLIQTNNQPIIILLEFKSPYSKIPEKNIIPKYLFITQ